jgi:hypothetical protein
MICEGVDIGTVLNNCGLFAPKYWIYLVTVRRDHVWRRKTANIHDPSIHKLSSKQKVAAAEVTSRNQQTVSEASSYKRNLLLLKDELV